MANQLTRYDRGCRELLVALPLLAGLLCSSASMAATFCAQDAGDLIVNLLLAEANGQDDVIRVAQGTYTGTFLYSSSEPFSLTIKGGYSPDCAQRADDRTATVLDGNGTGTALILTSTSSGDLTVEGLTIANGSSSSSDGGGLFASTESGEVLVSDVGISASSAVSDGGAAFLKGAFIRIERSSFSGSSAAFGGGVFVEGEQLEVFDTEFSGNNAVTEGGGLHADGESVLLSGVSFVDNDAVRVAGAALNATPMVTVVGSSFELNTATSTSSGGALEIVGSSEFVLEDSRFADNTGYRGAVYVNGLTGSVATVLDTEFVANTGTAFGGALNLTTAAQATVRGNTFTGNQVTLSGTSVGGAVYLSNVTDLTFERNGLSLNSAGDGGAVFFSSFGSAIDFVGNTLVSNSADDDGGGVYFDVGTTGDAIMVDNVFEDNHASDLGGGIYLVAGRTELRNNTVCEGSAAVGGGVRLQATNATLTNNTIVANTATTDGGGLWLRLQNDDETGTIQNSIIYDNTAPTGADLYIDNDGNGNFVRSPVTLTYCDFDPSSEGAFVELPFLFDSSNRNVEAEFVFDSYVLSGTSPLINAGTNDAELLPPLDQLGNPRILDRRADIGAIEHASLLFGFDGPNPGIAGEVNTFTISGVPEGVEVTLVLGLGRGVVQIPGCPEEAVAGVGQPSVIGREVADATGEAHFSVLVPGEFAGDELIFQAADIGGCGLSTLAAFTFPAP